MSSLRSLARPEIRALPPYSAAHQAANSLRLNANESAWTPTPKQSLNRYPALAPTRLIALLADLFETSPERLMVTRGSSEGIDLLTRTFCRPGVDNIVTPSPSFSMYAHYATLQATEVRAADLDANRNFSITAEEILSRCNGRTRLIFLCSPNNPTGSSIDHATIKRVAEQQQNRSLVVVDEAYIEYSDLESARVLIDQHANIVVLRTLSKAFAHAATRCGAVIANPEVLNLLRTVQAPYALASPVIDLVTDNILGGLVASARKEATKVAGERKLLRESLASVACVERVWPSDGNFLLTQFRQLAPVARQLEKDRILIRYLGEPLASCARITVGTASENQQLLASLERANP